MSAPEDLPDPSQVVSLALRREALLPNERGRGLGTVAVVCTMAGVASGLALATTLMAMQVADSMSNRQCPYQIEVVPVSSPLETSHNGFLGATYTFSNETHTAKVGDVKPGSPAQAVGLHVGDRVLAVDGVRLTHDDFKQRIAEVSPGSVVTLLVDRGGAVQTFRPILVAWPY